MSAFPEPGQVFSERYQLLETLGTGGIGTVFKALQLDCDRLVALKILHPEISADADMRKRFVKEAKALNELHHEGIVTIYHIGVSEDGLPYMAMEYIEGKSLRQLLNEQGKFPVSRAAKLCNQLAAALELIHSQEIVHRDLKPENIIVLDQPEPDTPKIIDFGLARFLQEQKSTKTGALVGSPVYMSPEQCMGKQADKASDIYSLCVIFFELITGAPPFDADNPIGLMYKNINEPVPQITAAMVDRSSPDLNEFFAIGLAKQAKARFASTKELASALLKLEKGEAVISTSSSKNKNKFTNKQLLLLTCSIFLSLILLVICNSRQTKTLETKGKSWRHKDARVNDDIVLLLRNGELSLS